MKRLFIILSFVFLLLPAISFAVPCKDASGSITENGLNLCYPSFGGQSLNLNSDNKTLGPLIAWVYYAIVGISSLAAFVMIVWGGVEYLGSSVNPGKTSEAKERIKQAVFGLLLVLASFLILQLVNPDLTIIK